MADLSSIPGLEGFSKFLGSAATGLEKLAIGSAKASDAFDLIAKAGGAIPVVGGAFEKIGGAAIKGADTMNQAMNSTANYGTSFTNNVGQFRDAIGNARMSTEDYKKSIAENSVGISGFGRNMDQSAKRFLEFNAVLQESQPAEKLKQAGVGSQEFTNLMAITMTNRRTLDMKDEAAKKAAIEGTMQLAIQMDDIARITGKSKEAQQKELAASLGRADVQAELLQMSDAQRTEFMKMKTAVGPLGESIGSLADEIATGGVRTKEGAAKMAALGPAGADFEKAVMMSKNAVTQKDKEEAAAAMERAKIRITEYQSSKEYLDQVKYDRTATGDAARAQFQQNATINSQLSAIRNEGVKTEQQLIDEKKKAAEASRKGVDMDTGKVEDGSKLGRKMNEIGMTVDAVQAAAGGKIKDLGDQAGKAAGNLKILANLPLTRGQAEKQFSAEIDKLTSTGGKPTSTPSEYKPNQKPQLFDGTMGPNMDFSKLMQDFGKGTTVDLHGKEGVINEKQLGALVNQIKSGASAAVESAKSATPTPPAPVPTAPVPASNNDATTMLSTQLNELNKMMGQLVSYSEQMAESAGAQLKATKGLSGNKLAV